VDMFDPSNVGNTREPFSAATARLTQHGDTLIIHTARGMYKGSDGVSHQAAMYVYIDVTPDVPMAQISRDTPWVSHSFNQFVLTDEGMSVFLDHGDAFPRNIAISKTQMQDCYYLMHTDGVRKITRAFPEPGGGYTFLGWWDEAKKEFVFPTGSQMLNGEVRFFKDCCQSFNNASMLDIGGTVGDNWTGVSLGGFAQSSSHYIAVANINDGFDKNNDTQRNIYSLTIGRNFADGAAGAQVLLATYRGTDKIASAPTMIKVAPDSFAVYWQEFANSTRNPAPLGYVLQLIDGHGRPSAQPKTFADLSSLLGEVFDTETPCPCRDCVICGQRGGAFGLGRVTNTGKTPEVADALAILRYVVGLSSPLSDSPSARSAARIVSTSGNPEVADALAILRFVVGLSSPLGAVWG